MGFVFQWKGWAGEGWGGATHLLDGPESLGGNEGTLKMREEKLGS